MSTKKDPPAWETGLMIGVIALALLMVFTVGLSRWHKNAIGESITLPATISGGFVAADNPQAWSSLVSGGKVQQQQVSQLVSQASDLVGKNSAAASQSLGIASASRYYISPQGNLLTVSAARGGAAAWFPGGGGTWSSHGDVTCYSSTSASSSGGSSTTNDCRRTSDNLTVEIQTSGLSADDTASKVDEVYNDIAGRHW